MGWLRLVGSLKLQVSFVKEPYKTDDILQKRPIILRSLLIECKEQYGLATISRLLKIIGFFATYRLFNRALLQKRPTILRSLPIVATPQPQ